MMFVGDISLGEHYFSFGHGPKTIAQKLDIFSSVKPVFAKADYVCGNLEGPISDIGLNPFDPESVVFRGAPASAQALASAGFNLMHVANNHIIQHGEAAYYHTLTLLNDNGVTPLGDHTTEYLFEKNGIKILLLAASGITDNTDEDQQLYAKIDPETLISRIRHYRDQVDWIFLSLHWGLEERVTPTSEQEQLAQRFRAAGANFIIGHHPHIVYPVESDKQYLCAWSLGNFIFDLPWDERLNQSAIIEIELHKHEFKARAYAINIDSSGFPHCESDAIDIHEGRFSLYQHNSQFRLFAVKKLFFFLFNFFRGNTSLKYTFIKRKILKKLGAS